VTSVHVGPEVADRTVVRGEGRSTGMRRSTLVAALMRTEVDEAATLSEDLNLVVRINFKKK
jgi:hypothetical protein